MLLKFRIDTPIGPMVLICDRAQRLLLSEFARDP
jgi:hypothetical protein